MAGLVGMGTLAFGSVGFIYRAEDGLTESGPEVPEVDCTPDGATSEQFESGDVVNHGSVEAVAIAVDTINTEDIVATTETLVITYPLGSNATAKTKTGPAICLKAARTTAKNTLNTYAVTYKWKDKPVVVDAT
jgi:predicted RecA/RadA family phage recombinase